MGVRLNGGESALGTPLKVRIKDGATTVPAKLSNHPQEKRELLHRYTDQLKSLGFVQVAQRTEWVAAPLLIPKKPPAVLRLTINYRPINAATVRTAWPMARIDAVLSNDRGARAFLSIVFCSEYRQLGLDTYSQHLYAFMTAAGIVQPTRTTEGGCKSWQNVQACIEP